MDRVTVYPGQTPLEVHILKTNKFAMLGVSKLAEALLGRDNVWVTGLNCTADGVQAFHVNISPGQVYQLAAIDATTYGGAIPADTNQVLKQGVLDETLSFSCPKPSSGQSIYYKISVAYVEQDDEADVLLYYNAANPEQPFNGPDGSGVAQSTRRAGKCIIQFTTGTAATTGSETVPATPAGFTALWTIRVSGNTTSIVNAASATTDGIWKVGAGNFIVFGGAGDLTQSAADIRYARIATANAFTNTQSINVNDPIAVHIFGSTSSAGAGIKITGDGATTPSKRIRVRGGALGIMNDAASPTDILVLSDAGNLSVTGTITAAGKITAGADPTNALDVVTKQYVEANFATIGVGGFITQTNADARYVRKDVGATSPQVMAGQLQVPAQPTVGTVDPNQLVTQGYVDSHYATLASSGITQTQADARYLMLSAVTPQTVNTTTTFNTPPLLTVGPTNDNHAVRKVYVDNNFAQKSKAGGETFTVTVGGQPPTADGHFTTRGFANSTYLQIGAGSPAQTIAKAVTFSTFPTVPTSGATGGQVVSAAQMAAAISSGQGITQTFADGRYAQKEASNNFSGLNTFQSQVTCLTDATNNTHLLSLGAAIQRFAPLNGPLFTGIPRGPGGNSGVTDGYVTYQQVFGSGGGGFATLNANTFAGTQTINPASGDCIVLGTSPTGLTGITFPSGRFVGIDNASGNFNFRSGGIARFVINSSNGNLSTTGSLLVEGNLSVSSGTASTFSAPVGVGTPTQGGHAVRQDQFSHSGNSSLGSIVLPNGYIINFGTASNIGVNPSSSSVSLHRSYSSVHLGCVGCPVSSSVTNVQISVFNLGLSTFSASATASGTTIRFISIGK